MIRPLVAVLGLAGLAAVQPAAAQLAAPNAAGVAMGHLHYSADDPAAERDFWVRLGGRIVASAQGAAVALPGVLILVSVGDASDDPVVIDHVAFRVESLAAVAGRGLELEPVTGFAGIVSVYTPSGARVELFEEGTATNVGFDPAVPNETAERHNRPLTGAIDSHHLHFYLPDNQVEAARDWYVRHFGAVPGIRWRYDAADLPGMNLNFSATETARAPSRGGLPDRIGFEVEDLAAFCRQLASAGVVFDNPFRRVSGDYAVATLTDPWGTTIELTEGLARR